MKFMGNSLILRTSTRLMLPLLLLFSVFLLFGGHNQPGGGFAGGLMAAAGFSLYALAYDAHAAQRAVRVRLQVTIGVGLLAAALSGMVGMIAGRPFLSGMWVTLPPIPGLPPIAVGTPILFDIGVYLVVVSVTLIIILSLGDEE
jgi:multicomponent Na+:H+ antiporter subunit B